MDAAQLLWIDLCTQPADHGLFQLLSIERRAVRVDGFDDFGRALQQCRPRLVCIEFDYPDKGRLQAVPALTRAFPELPLLMFTEYHSEALAVWAFRSGVSDYRVKPLKYRTLVRSIDALLAVAASDRKHRPAASWLPADLVEAAGHLQKPPTSSQKTGVAVAYVARHFADDLRCNALADLSHLSRSEFSRAFRREQGTSFKQFLLAYRISKARDLLAEPHMTVSDAAYSAGFSDTSYFSRLFRRLAGMTPSEYQDLVRPRHPVPPSEADG